jgi:nicotinamide-nucleotide amidase
MAFDADLTAAAEALVASYRRAGMRIVTAESCTGGLIAACLTAIAGSSDVVERGFVTYSNEAKTEMLGVSPATLQEHGAVSSHTAKAMAAGALAHSAADVAVAVTGIAGPGGGTAAKPVGLVYIAVQRRDHTAEIERHMFTGDRNAIRMESVAAALDLLRHQLP